MPTNQCLWELQKAVFAALDDDEVLSPMITGVYSHVPQDTAFPYVSFGNIQSSDWSTNTTTGVQVSFSINVFSRHRGSKEVLEVLAEIKRILNMSVLPMVGCTMLKIRYTGEDVSQLADGLTWRGSINFNVFVNES